MTWSIVRTCRRCGSRAEKPIATPEMAARVALVLEHHFRAPDSDDGCPKCDPELAEKARAAGIDLDEYRAAVARASKTSPS